MTGLRREAHPRRGAGGDGDGGVKMSAEDGELMRVEKGGVRGAEDEDEDPIVCPRHWRREIKSRGYKKS